MEDDILDFYVASSSGTGGYCVTFDLSDPDDGLNISCDCPAGRNGLLCKHLKLIIQGDESIFDPEMNYGGFDPNEWEKSREIVKQYNLLGVIDRFTKGIKPLEKEKKKRIAELEKEKKRINAEFKKEKKKLIDMFSGIKPQDA